MSRYLSAAQIVCFDGESGNPPAEPPKTAPELVAGAQPTVFTQDQVNKILADDRRKHQAALEKTETTYKELLANSANLSSQERATLEENLAVVQGQLRTKEQQAALEKKQLEEQHQKHVAEHEARAKTWENRYRDETIDRALLDAAVAGDAYSPNQVATLIRSMTRLVDTADSKTGKPTGKFNAIVEFPDVDPNTGENVILPMSPKEAVKRMQALPEYANLFKANLVSGLGANSSVAGMAPGGNGKVDASKLSHEQYRKLRAENPSALGLRPASARRGR